MINKWIKKNILFLAIICVITFFSATNYANAAGTFTLISPKSSQLTAAVNLPFSAYINYSYSGDYFSSASIVAADLPESMKLGTINYGANGVSSVPLLFTPTTIGDYPITLVLTDNHGATLSQSYDINVINPAPFQLKNQSLPDGVIGKQYSSSIYIDYFGFSPNVNVSNIPDGLSYKFNSISKKTAIPQGTFEIIISGYPSKAGKYLIALGLVQKNVDIGSYEEKTIPININNEYQQQYLQQPIATSTTPIPAPVVVLTSTPTTFSQQNDIKKAKYKDNVNVQFSNKLTKITSSAKQIEPSTTLIQDTTTTFVVQTTDKPNIFTTISLNIKTTLHNFFEKLAKIFAN